MLFIQAQAGQPYSVLELYKTLISLRSDLTFSRGWLCVIGSTQNMVV